MPAAGAPWGRRCHRRHPPPRHGSNAKGVSVTCPRCVPQERRVLKVWGCRAGPEGTCPQAGTCVCVPRVGRDLLKHLGSPPCPCPAFTAPVVRIFEVWGSFRGAAGALRSLLPAPSRHAPRGEAPASLALGAGPVPPGRPRCSEGALQWTRPYGGRDTVLGAAGLPWYNCGANPHPCPAGTVTAPLCHPPWCTGLSTPR